MLTLLINESNPLDGLFANSTTGGVGTVPDITVADDGQAVSVQSFTRAGGIITDSFVAGDVLHIGIGDGVNAPVCYVALSSASPATGTMPINTAGMVALFAATAANQISLTLAVVRTRGAYTNTIFSAPIVIRRSAINISTAVPTPSILGTGVAAALQVAINTALGFVRLDASARLPAVDGSQLTNLPNTGGVTSITGTANEITVTGTTTPTLSLPSALTFTGKTVTGGTFASPTFTTPDLGTPSALVGTNITGTASGLTAGTVTTNANLTGHVTSTGNAAVLGSFTFAQLNTAVSDADLARTSSTNTFTGVQSLTSPDITTSITTPSTSFTAFAGATTLMTLGGTGASASTFFPSTLDATSSITGAIRTSGGISAAKAANFGTTIRGGSSLTLGAAGGTVGSVVLNGSTSGAATITVSATGVLAMPSGTYNSITSNNTVSAATVIAQNQAAAAVGIDISSTNSGTQVTAGHPWMRVGGSSSEYLMINAGLTGGYVDFCTDLGSGVRVWDGTGGHFTYLTAPATGTLRVTTNGSTLGTVDAATFTGNAATVTTNANLTGDVTSVGNATTLAAGSASALNSGTLADARLSANVPLKDAANTFTNTQSMTSPDITTSITTPSTTFALVNATATTVNFAGGASTALNMGNASGTNTILGSTALNGALSTACPARTSGSAAFLTITTPADTAQTASTESIGVNKTAATRQFGTGALTTQREVVFAAPTYSFVGASTLTTAVNVDMQDPQAGTNATLTNKWAARASSLRVFSPGTAGPADSRFIFEVYAGRYSRLALKIDEAGVTTMPQGLNLEGGNFAWSSSHGTSINAAGWRMAANNSTTCDATISRNAAGIVQIGTTAFNALGSLLLTNLTASGTLAVTGATTLTGNLTSNGALISTPQALTGAGAVNVTTLTTAVTTTAPAQALTLADGTNGQIKTIVHQALSGGGTWVLTPTTKTGYTTITSIAVGETCTLQFFTTIGWCILSLRGAIAA